MRGIPHADTYWVGPARAGEYPLRFGDLCPAPVLAESSDSKGRPWTAVVVLMPSCELNAKAKPETRVALARVRRVNDLGQRQRGAVRVGWQERDGRVLIAHGYTFWMPPAPNAPNGGEDDLYLTFRDLCVVPLPAVGEAGRLAALSHAACCALIRREL